MTINDKKRVILYAIELGLVSGRAIDVSGRGGAIADMKRGANMTDERVNNIFDRLVDIVGQEKIDELAEPAIYKKLRALEIENAILKRELDEMKAKQKNIRGWTLQKTGNYWRVVRKINGKLKWLHVGADKSKAEQKIIEYERANNVNHSTN